MIAGAAIALIAVAVFTTFIILPSGGAMNGDNVSLYYSVMFENGTLIDTNMNGTPVQCTIGSSGIIPGLSDALAGMGPGQKKTVTIPSDQAYGPYRSDLVHVVNRTGYIANMTFVPGNYYVVHRKADNAMSRILILNVTPSTVAWDENSPLAGQNLVFTIQVVALSRGSGANSTASPSPPVLPAVTMP